MGDICVRLCGQYPAGTAVAGQSWCGSPLTVLTVYSWRGHHTDPAASSGCFHIYHMEDFWPNQQSENRKIPVRLHCKDFRKWWFTWARMLSLSDRIVSRILVSELLFPELISSWSSCIIWSSWADTVRTSSLHLPINKHILLMNYELVWSNNCIENNGEWICKSKSRKCYWMNLHWSNQIDRHRQSDSGHVFTSLVSHSSLVIC